MYKKEKEMASTKGTKSKPKSEYWKRMGGGCYFVGNMKFPCDDEYRNTKTGKCVTVYSTIEAHFSMPSKIGSIKQLLNLPNVRARQKQ